MPQGVYVSRKRTSVLSEFHPSKWSKTQKISSPAAKTPRAAPEPAGRIRGLAVYVWVYAPTLMDDGPAQLSRATAVVETPPPVLTMTEKATRIPFALGIANESWSSQAPLTGTVKRKTMLKV
eukprot:6174063-Pleurochrysis_carterae.AAC.2